MTGFFGPGGFESGSFDDFLARFLGGEQRRQMHRVDLMRLLSEQGRQLLSSAAEHAAQQRRSDLDAEHLLWAATQDPGTRQLLSEAGADPDSLAYEIDRRNEGLTPSERPPTMTPAAKRALLDSYQISRAVGSSYIGPEHILLALDANPESSAGRLLADFHVTPDDLQQAASGRRQQPAPEPVQTGTPTLDDYAQDLTRNARDGELDPVIGREHEIEQTIEVLSRRTKNNPVLVGEAGVGKTAIVEGLAQRIADGDVPGTLLGKRVVELDLAGLVAGTRYRGDFEERMKKVIDEIRAHHDQLIVFIDEVHTIVGAGSSAEGSMDASNMFKPALSRGEVHVIGATTLDEYRKNIEKDAALERRFQPVLVPEPSIADTVAILHGLRDRYEAHHQVRFSDEAISAAAEMSDRYVSDRFLPDKAIDLIDQAGARVRLRTKTPTTDLRELQRQVDQLCRDKDAAVTNEEYERASQLRDQISELKQRMERSRTEVHPDVPTVTVNDVAEVVSRSTGIPVSQLTQEERQRLVNLEQQLHERVVGQHEAIEAISEAIRRSRAGMADPDRPVGSFLFLGPTGVGKTEVARALAGAMFGDETHMVRLDMSEFQERHTVSRMIGAPPGYVGYGESGQLTEAVRRRPYSVVLLDEVEKAHPDVFNTLLQVLDDGRLTDGQGRTVDFRNTVLIMTSNVGSEVISSSTGGIGFAGTEGREAEQPLRDRVMYRLRDEFRPEFLNRIDEIIIFRRLDDEQLRKITDLMLDASRRRLHAQNVTVEFSAAVVDWLARRGHQPEYGARPLRRTIQREIDNPVSRLLLDGQLRSGQHLRVDLRDDQPDFEVTTAASPTGDAGTPGRV